MRNGRYLQAAIGKLPFPAQMYAKVAFKPGDRDTRFDFSFDAFSKEPKVAPSTTMTNATPATAPASTAPAAAAPVTAAPTPAPDRRRRIRGSRAVPLPIPETVPEMLAQLRTRTDQIRTFIDKGAFAAHLRAGVPGEGSRARARRAQEGALPTSASGRGAGDRAGWCARRICSTRSATSATSSRSSKPTIAFRRR